MLVSSHSTCSIVTVDHLQKQQVKMKDVWNHRQAHVSIKSYILLQLGISSLDIFYKMRKKTTSDSKWRVWHIWTNLSCKPRPPSDSPPFPIVLPERDNEPNVSGCIHQITLGYHVLGRFLSVPNLTSKRKNETDWCLTPHFLAVKLLLTKKCLLWPLAPRCWVFAPPSLRCWWPYESERRQMWCKWNQVSWSLWLGRTKSAVVGQDWTRSSVFTMWTG